MTAETRTTQLQWEIDGSPSQNMVFPAPTLPIWARGRAESYDDPLAWCFGISELWHNQFKSLRAAQFTLCSNGPMKLIGWSCNVTLQPINQ